MRVSVVNCVLHTVARPVIPHHPPREPSEMSDLTAGRNVSPGYTTVPIAKLRAASFFATLLEQLLKLTALKELESVVASANVLAVNEDIRNGALAREARQRVL